MLGDGLPALVPDAARPEHGVVLRLLGGRRVGCRVEGVLHRHAGDRCLLVAVDELRELQTACLEDGRHDVDGVVVLVAHLALGLDALGPVDHHRVAHAALVGVPLEHAERRREPERPSGRVVVVGLRSAEHVDHRQVLGEVVGPLVEELVLVDRSVRRSLGRGAVVGAVEDQRVLQLAGLLEVVDDAADLVIGVLGEPGIDLGHAAEQPLLVGVQRVPRPHEVARRERALGHRIDRRQLGALGEDAALDHPRQHPLAVRLVAVVERSGVLVDELLRRVVRGMVGAGAEEHVPGLVRPRLLGVADERHRLVGEVLGEVVAVLGPVGLVHVVVVVDERGIPLVGLAADEPVEAVEPACQWPLGLRPAHVPRVGRHVVVLADPVGVVPLLAQDLRRRRSPWGCSRSTRGTRSLPRRCRRTRSGGGCDRSAGTTWSGCTVPSCATACR